MDEEKKTEKKPKSGIRKQIENRDRKSNLEKMISRRW
jgi:hypothetical protein